MLRSCCRKVIAGIWLSTSLMACTNTPTPNQSGFQDVEECVQAKVEVTALPEGPTKVFQLQIKNVCEEELTLLGNGSPAYSFEVLGDTDRVWFWPTEDVVDIIEPFTLEPEQTLMFSQEWDGNPVGNVSLVEGQTLDLRARFSGGLEVSDEFELITEFAY